MLPEENKGHGAQAGALYFPIVFAFAFCVEMITATGNEMQQLLLLSV